MRSITMRTVLGGLVVMALLSPAAASAQGSCVQPGSGQLIVYHAGSLSAAFTPVEQAFTCQTGVQVQDVTGGSVDLVRQVTAGGKPADILASADYVDIDNFLKPTGAATYNVVFARGRMVLGYSQSGAAAKNLPSFIDPAAPPFSPTSVPTVTDNWIQVLQMPGVVVGGSHPYLDPSGYRSHLMFQLAQAHYGTPNLYNNLLQHYLALPASAAQGAFTLGKQYDFQLIYEHSAAGLAATNPDYRYAYLPEDVDLSNPARNDFYKQAVVKMPGLGTPGSDDWVDVPATRTAWGLTVLETAPNRENAIRFLQLLLAPGEIGQATLQKVGPSPVSPAVVSPDDWQHVPGELRNLLTSGDPLAI
jgi:molybdate/tungstate transport system substrate-binding protein